MPIFDTPSIAQILRKVGKTMTTFLRIGLVSSVSIVLVANTSARKTTAIAAPRPVQKTRTLRGTS